MGKGIAVIVSVGPLDRFGYQNVYEPCVDSFTAFADRVYFVSTTPETMHVNGIPAISTELTWFQEGFNIYHIVKNMNLALEIARADGYDCIVDFSINCYLPEANRDALREHCERMVAWDEPWMWLYRMDQLGNQMFHASGAKPWIVNLKHDWRFGMDRLVLGEERVDYKLGDFRDMDGIAYVDVGMEMTLDDLEAKMNYIRCYHDLVPKRDPKFDWGFWYPYWVNKYRQRAKSDAIPDAYGQRIVSKPEFVSHMIRSEL